MRLVIAIAALALPVSSAPAERIRPPLQSNIGAVPMRPCDNPLVHHADKRHKGEFNRLGELPPGDLILSVLRGTDGCFNPVIVRQGFGAGAEERPEARGMPQPQKLPRKPQLIR